MRTALLLVAVVTVVAMVSACGGNPLAPSKEKKAETVVWGT